MLTESLKLKFLCENIAFVLNNNHKQHTFAQLLIGHNYTQLKSGAFSLDMSIIRVLIILYPTRVTFFVHYAKKCNSITFLNRPRGYKPFFVLNSAEHEIHPAHKCLDTNNCWHLSLISIANTSERLKARSFFIYRYCCFYEQLKFRAQLVEHEQSFFNLRACFDKNAADREISTDNSVNINSIKMERKQFFLPVHTNTTVDVNMFFLVQTMYKNIKT